jgi:hypothetical protein
MLPLPTSGISIHFSVAETWAVPKLKKHSSNSPRLLDRPAVAAFRYF